MTVSASTAERTCPSESVGESQLGASLAVAGGATMEMVKLTAHARSRLNL